MPVESNLPRIDVPNVDIWTFLFERKDKAFPNDKSMHDHSPLISLAFALTLL